MPPNALESPAIPPPLQMVGNALLASPVALSTRAIPPLVVASATFNKQTPSHIPLPETRTIDGPNAPPVAPPICRPPLTTEPAAEDSTDIEPSLVRRSLESFPAWGVSCLVHMIVVLALALWGVETWQSRAGLPTLTIDTSAEATPYDQGESQDDWAAAAIAQSAVVALPSDDVAYFRQADVELFPLDEAPVVEAASPLMEESVVDGKNSNASGVGSRRGKGKAKTHPGDEDLLQAETSFYGVRGEGKRFCFVVDNSGSMSGARFQSALRELSAAVDKLNESQAFYIVFFSNGAYPMFFPGMEPDMIRATNENKLRVAAWLRYVDLGPATRGSKAMQIAFRMRPDTIFMLGDGDFGDNTVVETINKKTPAIKIHTIGLEIPRNSPAERGFRAIAEAFYGTYRNVPVNGIPE